MKVCYRAKANTIFTNKDTCYTSCSIEAVHTESDQVLAAVENIPYPRLVVERIVSRMNASQLALVHFVDLVIDEFPLVVTYNSGSQPGGLRPMRPVS